MSRPGNNRLRTALVVLTVIGHVAAGVAAQKEVPRIPTGTGSIAGRIIDRGSGGPLAEAMVTLQSTEALRVLKTTNDRDGRYLFEGIGPGEYRVTASHDGYVTQEFGRSPIRRSRCELKTAASTRSAMCGRAGTRSVAWIDPEMVKARVAAKQRPTYYPRTNTSAEAVHVQVMVRSRSPA